MSFRLRNGPPSTVERVAGCGCLGLIAVICGGVIVGAMMGDYFGPESGKERDQAEKRIRMIGGVIGMVLCGVAGFKLLTKKD